ncbi:hypothetical protein SAMN06296241_1390 [Salinimicrobium sediminis]|uniref:Uncharacterized protein n=1 Tax=Salinimicrobium sediminis TaxID=1343891 RepID=A0A285X3G1_9FLAO|nr:hypothetical protein [Salinimicrobium sediminis]SOC79852.1 hypothetical protein SAMN06296241_1390 [Salinimicrobium sediminis]
MKLEIIFKDGRWLVNGKRLHELNTEEKEFMNDFFREFKIWKAEEDEEIRHFINRQAGDQEASINYNNFQKQVV